MARLSAALFSLLVFVSAFAQEAKEAPVEPVNTAGVVGFLVLFFGSIIAYGIYLWWTARNKKDDK